VSARRALHGLPAALAVALALAAAPALAATPLALVERQVTTLEFTRPVASLATTDPDLLQLERAGTHLKVTALRGGRAQLDVIFDDGAQVTFDVAVGPLRGPTGLAASAGGPSAGPVEVSLAVGEERRLPSPGLARVLIEENGVARVRAEGEAVIVVGVTPGRSSLVLVDGAGRRTTLPLRVR
jgi:Pilus formation protein N terminal region